MLRRISGQIGSVTLPPLRERDWPMPLKLCRIQNYQNLLMNRIQTRIPVEYEWVLVPALCGDCGVLSGTNKPENCKAAKNKSKGPKELSKYLQSNRKSSGEARCFGENDS